MILIEYVLFLFKWPAIIENRHYDYIFVTWRKLKGLKDFKPFQLAPSSAKAKYQQRRKAAAKPPSNAATDSRKKRRVIMTMKRVATVALFTAIALAWGSNAEAQELRRMSENCLVTGAHYNALLDKLEALEKRMAKLESLGFKAQAKKLRAWTEAQKKGLKAERKILLRIARLKAEIRRIKKNRRMSKLAKRAAISALRAEIRRLRAKLKKLKQRQRMKLFPFPGHPTTSPATADATKVLGKALDGLTNALDGLIAQMKQGVKAPEVVKSLNRLLIQMKMNGDNTLDLIVAVNTLNKRLRKGIKVRGGPGLSGPTPRWAGWHFRLGVGTMFTSLNGSGNIAVPLQVEGAVEYVTRNHLGLRAGLNLGVWFTREEDRGNTYTVAPFGLSGYMSGVISWEHFSLVIPQVRVHFLQGGIHKKGGHLWTTLHAGVEFHIQRRFALEVLLGTAVHSTLPRLNGLVIGVGIYYCF